MSSVSSPILRNGTKGYIECEAVKWQNWSKMLHKVKMGSMPTILVGALKLLSCNLSFGFVGLDLIGAR